MTDTNDSPTTMGGPEATLPPAQFRKTKAGKWAVVAPVVALEAALGAGGGVDVLKKSGDWGKFTVASLGRPFDVDGVPMCYGYGPGDESAATEDRPAATPRRTQGPPSRTVSEPPRDVSEPLPEYRGGPDDEWTDSF